jgi:hypothetical protein
MDKHSDSTKTRFNAVIELSGDMLKSALIEDWDQVIALESQRDTLIMDLFAEPLTLPPDVVAEKIQIILDINQQLLEYGKRHRDELQQEMLKLFHGKKSVQLYQE